MWGDMGFWPEDNSWQVSAQEVFARGLAEGNFAGFVVDHPAEPKLIACGLAVINQLMPAFWNPNGKMGYIHWMVTEKEFRGQGIGTQILELLTSWLIENGVARTQLHATPAGETLYLKHDWEHSHYTNLWKVLDNKHYDPQE